MAMSKSEPPPWLDAAFVQEALRRGGDADALVTSVTLRPVGAAGDNYASAMWRITAETGGSSRSLICKTPPSVEAFKESFANSNEFSHEATLLSEIIPAMEKILQDAAPGRFPPIAPRCPHHGSQPEDFIFLEDLAVPGFRLANRHRGLGLRHSLLAMRTLARFHASSAAILARDPSIQQRLGNPYRNFDESSEKLVKAGFEMTAVACRNWSEVPQECVDALEASKETAWQKHISLHEPMPDCFNVIIHGDLWLNNIMFQYEDGEVKGIRLVDFQQSHVASPTIDLLHFLGSSVSEDVSANYTDLLLREYYVELKETMMVLSLEAPSFQDILEDMNTNGFYVTFSATCLAPMMKSDELLDLEKALMGDADEFSFIFQSPRVKKWLCRVLPEYHQKGWLSLNK